MSAATTTQIPDGYMKDGQGRLVPVDQVKEIDLARDELVKEIIAKAKGAQKHMSEFKDQAMDDVGAFVQLSGEQYEIRLGGKKGNVTLVSYDGQYKIQRSMSETIVFDERLQVAKELIDSCIHRWTEGSSDKIRALVEHAFKADSEGRVSTGRIIGLKQLKMEDEEWHQAMQAINDSMKVAGTKAYIRFYERDGKTGRYEAIPLDVAAL